MVIQAIRSTGLPLRNVGSYCQRSTASCAAFRSMFGPLTTWAATTLPSLPTQASSFTKPLTLQTDPSRHGGLTDPVVTLYHDAVNLAGGHHVGTDLHLPWVAVSTVLLVVVFRKLPVSYGLYSLAIVGLAASGSNLDSFERYALSAFPLLLGAATLLRSRRVEVTVLVLCGVSMFGYALLAFLGAYVP